jgi:hypothetical protein
LGILLFFIPAEASPSKANNANNDENDADNSSWFLQRMLQRPSAANQLQNEHHHGDHEQDVNVSAENVETHKTQQPKNQQNDEDSPKHINLSVRVVTHDSLCHAKPRVTKFRRRMSIFYLLSSLFQDRA